MGLNVVGSVVVCSIAGVGIAQGHIRISSTCLSSVKPGSIILIYNSDELSITNDETDSNGDCIYIFPINSSCLEPSKLPLLSSIIHPFRLTFAKGFAAEPITSNS